MGEHPGSRPPAKVTAAKVTVDESAVTPEQQRSIAHARGRICKLRSCEVCAPLRERRRLQKARRKADAQAQLHAKGEPCGRNHCPVAICVRARHADEATPAAVVPRDDEPNDGHGAMIRRQAERHRAGMPCGSELCGNAACIDGFAQERARRHRARRPCRSTDCANPICVAHRSTP